MKQAILFLTLLLFTVAARAGDYKSLVFQTADGTTSVDLSELVITVADGKLVAANASGTVTIDASTLTKMYFSTDEATGIESVTTTGEGAKLDVYDLQGRKVGSYDNLQSARQALRQGMYVIRQDGRTFKIAVK